MESSGWVCSLSTCVHMLPFVLCILGLDKQKDGRDRQTDNTSHKDKQMDSDVNTHCSSHALIWADCLCSNSEFFTPDSPLLLSFFLFLSLVL